MRKMQAPGGCLGPVGAAGEERLRACPQGLKTLALRAFLPAPAEEFIKSELIFKRFFVYI